MYAVAARPEGSAAAMAEVLVGAGADLRRRDGMGYDVVDQAAAFLNFGLAGRLVLAMRGQQTHEGL